MCLNLQPRPVIVDLSAACLGGARLVSGPLLSAQQSAKTHQARKKRINQMVRNAPAWPKPSAAVLDKAFCFACHGRVNCKQSRSSANPRRWYLTCWQGGEHRMPGCGAFFQWADELPQQFAEDEGLGQLYASRHPPATLQRAPHPADAAAVQCPGCSRRNVDQRCAHKKRDNGLGNYGRWFSMWCAVLCVPA